MACAAARPRPGSSASRRPISARPASSASRRIAATRCLLPARANRGDPLRQCARRSMIARWLSMSNRLIARSPRALSGGRAHPAPRAGVKLSGSTSASAAAIGIGGRLGLGGGREQAADRRARRRFRRSRRGPLRAWRAPSLARATTAGGRPGELGDGDAVAAVGGAVGDFVEKDQIAFPLARADVVKRQAVEPSGEPGQLVIMGGEQSPALDLVVHRLDHRPGDREPVIGRGAAADLVEDDQAAGASPGRGSRRSRPSRP